MTLGRSRGGVLLPSRSGADRPCCGRPDRRATGPGAPVGPGRPCDATGCGAAGCGAVPDHGALPGPADTPSLGGCHRLWPSIRRCPGRRRPVRRPAAGACPPGCRSRPSSGSPPRQRAAAGADPLHRYLLERPPADPPRYRHAPAWHLNERRWWAPRRDANSNQRQVRDQWLPLPLWPALTGSSAVTLLPAATGEQPAGLPR